MSNLRQALAEINAIRTQVARDTQFRGYGPVSIAASGVLALCVAAAETHFVQDSHDFPVFLRIWIATAAITVLLTAIETVRRARRVHSGMANEMIHAAVEQFLPAIVASILLTVVLTRVASQELWMLPGLWELLFSMAVFASCRFLPRQTIAIGIWYLVAGLTCLVAQSGPHAFSPWAMGIPFGVGQLLVAAVLQFGFEKSPEDA